MDTATDVTLLRDRSGVRKAGDSSEMMKTRWYVIPVSFFRQILAIFIHVSHSSLAYFFSLKFWFSFFFLHIFKKFMFSGLPNLLL